MTLRKIEADARRPSRQIAKRLAEALELPAAEHASFIRAACGEQSTDYLSPPTHYVSQPPYRDLACWDSYVPVP